MYLVYWYFEEYAPNASTSGYVHDYPTLLNLHSEKRFDINDAQHEVIADEYIGKITDALYQYSQQQGYNIDLGYIAALAWGGLQESDVFKQHFNSTQEANISNVINIELKGVDNSGNSKPQKGSSTNCN